jgi:hypothetical protein
MGRHLLNVLRIYGGAESHNFLKQNGSFES